MEKRIGDIITYFELLEMMKNGTEPNKVKFMDIVYEVKRNTADYDKFIRMLNPKMHEYRGDAVSYQANVKTKTGYENHYLGIDLTRSTYHEFGVIMNQVIEVIE